MSQSAGGALPSGEGRKIHRSRDSARVSCLSCSFSHLSDSGAAGRGRRMDGRSPWGIIMRIASLLLLVTLSSFPSSAWERMSAAEPKPAEWKAGVAVQVITPEQSMWMAGYGNRNKPAEGKLTDLYVKVLALEDPHGGRLVLLTSDLVGIPRSLSEPVA